MNNHLPSRRPLLLKGYDYSKAGFYFLTLCVQDKIHLFGKCLQINDAGNR
jgi:putative transposase